jgi:hypothetical protein
MTAAERPRPSVEVILIELLRETLGIPPDLNSLIFCEGSLEGHFRICRRRHLDGDDQVAERESLRGPPFATRGFCFLEATILGLPSTLRLAAFWHLVQVALSDDTTRTIPNVPNSCRKGGYRDPSGHSIFAAP